MSIVAKPVDLRSSSIASRWPKTLALSLVLVVAAWFVLHYVFRYYLHYSQAGFSHYGGANYWRMRGWLLLHITTGMLALLIGPWQFSGRLRRRYLQLHRVAGRVYVYAVLFGSVAAVKLGLSTTFGKAFGYGLIGLAFAWASVTLMAFYAARQREIAIHKEWMIRSYVVTFGFVTFRVFNDYPPMMHWLPDADRAKFLVWASWAIPLLITDMILQARRMRTIRAAKARR